MRIGILCAAALVACATSAGAMWSLGDHARNGANYAELIVVGRLVHVDREAVRRKGCVFSKRIGRIRVERVLMAEEGHSPGDEVEVIWGNVALNVGLPVTLDGARRETGVWLLRKLFGGRHYALVGPEEAFFVPISDKANVRRITSGLVAPYAAQLSERNGRWELALRYRNPTDAPLSLPVWRMERDALRAPPGYMLSIGPPFAEERKETCPVLSSTEVTDADAVLVVPPHAWVERTADVSAWITPELSRERRLWVAVKHDDQVTYLSWARLPSAEEPPELEIWVLNDEGKSIRCYPSTRNVRWLLMLGGPLSLIAFLLALKKRRKRAAVVAAGLFLGIVYTFLVVTYGTSVLALAFTVTGKEFLMPDHNLANAALLASLLCLALIIPLMRSVMLAARRRITAMAKRDWALLWALWLGMPLAAAGCIAFVEGIYALAL